MNRILALTVLFVVLVSCEKNKDYLITIHTEYGDMKAILYEETPLHKKNFIELVKAGRYDSTIWHRIIKDFMIQGGDIQTKEGIRETEDDRIPAEIVKGFYHTKGAIAAARQGDNVNPDKMSSSSQFYIVDGKAYTEAELTTDQMKLNQSISTMLQDDKYDSLRGLFAELQAKRDFDGMNKLALDCREYVENELSLDLSKKADPNMVATYSNAEGAPHLDQEYTVFGRVVEGLDVIDKIAAVKTARGDKPVKSTYMTIELELVNKKEITKKYGYQYPTAKKIDNYFKKTNELNNSHNTSINGTYSYQDSQLYCEITVRQDQWTGKWMIISGVGTAYDKQNMKYESGIVKGTDLYENSGYVKIGYILNGKLITSAFGSQVTLTKNY